MKKLIFIAFVGLMMSMVSCSNNLKKIQDLVDEQVVLAKEYCEAEKDLDGEKMEKLLKRGIELDAEIQELGKDLTGKEKEDFTKENKSKVLNYDVQYFQVAQQAYEMHTAIKEFKKQGNKIIYSFVDDPEGVSEHIIEFN